MFTHFPSVALSLLLLTAPASLRSQEWRGGRVRIEGTVKNEKGEPVAGAKVHMRWKGRAEGPDVTTDKKGKWAILGIAGGSWNIDFEAPGYAAKQISVELREAERNPPVDVQLKPAQPAAREEILLAGKKISKEAAEAIEKGNTAMTVENFGQARTEYMKALPEAPDNIPLLMRVAAAYYGEGNFVEAVNYAKKVVEKDPQNTIAWRMIAEIELQRGNLETGSAALDKLPSEKIKDGQPFLNMGILLYNKKKPQEAEAAFNKALGIQPDLADAYYMRGLARLQLKRKAEGKADLEKYLELSPNGAEAKGVREILKAL